MDGGPRLPPRSGPASSRTSEALAIHEARRRSVGSRELHEARRQAGARPGHRHRHRGDRDGVDRARSLREPRCLRVRRSPEQIHAAPRAAPRGARRTRCRARRPARRRRAARRDHRRHRARRGPADPARRWQRADHEARDRGARDPRAALGARRAVLRAHRDPRAPARPCRRQGTDRWPRRPRLAPRGARLELGRDAGAAGPRAEDRGRRARRRIRRRRRDGDTADRGLRQGRDRRQAGASMASYASAPRSARSPTASSSIAPPSGWRL